MKNYAKACVVTNCSKRDYVFQHVSSKLKSLSNLETVGIDGYSQLSRCYQYLILIIYVDLIKTKCLYFFNNRQHIVMKPIVFMNDLEILIDEERKYVRLNFDRYVSWTYCNAGSHFALNYLFKYFCQLDSPGIKMSSS